MPIPTSMIASFTSSAVPQTGQRYGYSLGGGPKGASWSALACGSSSGPRISSPSDRLEFVIHHPIFWVPDLPHAHLMMAVRADQRIAPGTFTVAFSVVFGSDNLDRPLDDAPHLGQGLTNQTFDLCKRLGRLHAIIPDPFASFGKAMLNHPTNKGVDIHPLPLHPFASVGAVVVGNVAPLITVKPPQGDRRTDDVFGEIPG